MEAELAKIDFIASAAELGISALSLRDAAKGVGQAIVKLEVPKTVMIVIKSLDNAIVLFSREVARHLIETDRTSGQLTVFVDSRLEGSKQFAYPKLLEKSPLYAERLKFWTDEFCETNGDSIDFIITLGGDGTVLHAAWLFQNSQVPPVIPFHLGSLGFLTVFSTSDVCAVLGKAVGCKGRGIRVNMRMRLSCTIFRLKKDKFSYLSSVNGTQCKAERTLRDDDTFPYDTIEAETFQILNDLVIDRGPSANMSQLEIYVENKHLTSVQADGLVVATPTGSTAYSVFDN